MTTRVWDRFLTERDKAHLALRPRRPVAFGERPALILVDVYRGVYGDRPEPLLEAVKAWPSSCGLEAWTAIPYLQQLIQAARDAAIPVIHTTGVSDMVTWGDATRGNGKDVPRGDPSQSDRVRRHNDIIDEVAPLPGELVIRKASPSAFWGTPLVAHLNHLRADTLIVAGESTSGCVRGTVVDGCTYRFKVLVPEECVFDRQEATHAMNLFDMHQKYAEVLPVADVLAYMARVKR